MDSDSRKDRQTKRQQLDKSKVDLVETYTRSASAHLFANGLLKSSDAELQDLLRTTPTNDSIKNAIEESESSVARQLFRGSKHVIDNKPRNFGSGHELAQVNMLASKTGDDLSKTLDQQAEVIGTLIEFNQKVEGNTSQEDHLKAASTRTHLQARKVRNTVFEPNTAFLAVTQLAWSAWDLRSQRAHGRINDETFDKRVKEKLENMSQILDAHGSAGTDTVRSAQRNSFNAINTLVNHDDRRQKLHGMADDLRRNPTNLKKVDEALALFSPAMRQTYHSKTMTEMERRDFWRQVEDLTKTPLSPVRAVKLMSLEMAQISREHAEVAIIEAKDINEKPLAFLENDKKRTAAEAESKRKEAAQKHRDRKQAIGDVQRSVQGAFDKGAQHAVQDLKITDRG